MKTIETIGIPGSGKSTINKLLVKNNKGRVLTPEYSILNRIVKNERLVTLLLQSKIRKIITDHFYAKNNNELLSDYLIDDNKLLSFILNSEYYNKQSRNDKVFVFKWMLKLIVDYQLSKGKEDKYFIFDEGFLHKSISLFVNPNQDQFEDSQNLYSELNEYLRIIPIPSAVVFVDIDIDIAFERLRSRGFTKRTKNNSESKIMAYLNFCDKVVRYIVRIMEKRECQIIIVKNNNGISSLDNQINQNINF